MTLGLLLALATCSTSVATTANIGYSNGTVSKTKLFGMGSTKQQGLAIKLTADKLKQLKGHTISYIQTVFGTRNTTGKKAHLFISTSLDGTPLVEQDITLTRDRVTKWGEDTLKTPYAITGEEPALYIGYTAEVDPSYSLHSADGSADTEGLCYAYGDGAWTDIYGKGYGCANVRAVIDDAPAFTDVLLKTFEFPSYYKAGTAYQYAGQIFNFGTETITSLDVTLQTGNGTPVSQTLSGLSIAPGETYDITFPDYTATTAGSTSLQLAITAVNGAADADPADNEGATNIYFYPENMERSLLLEGFTGQTCPNCPTGHATVNSFLSEATLPVAEMWHHIGYYPDYFTMAQDDAYLLFYGSRTSTYAPSAMLNRYTMSSISSAPMLNIQSGGKAYLTTTANHIVENCRPYVSLKFETTYDETTRQANIRLTAYAHEDLPEGQNLYNIAIVQDGMHAYQYNGGDNYKHTMVFRGSLLGNAWGKTLPDTFGAGDSLVLYDGPWTLPEAITSDYWDLSTVASLTGDSIPSMDPVIWPTDAANTYLIAYVGAYGGNSDASGHEVYNCTQVKLGESYTQAGVTAIEAVMEQPKAASPVIRTDGRTIRVEGADSYTIYNIGGQMVPSAATLDRGLYIVRATAGGQTTAQKVLLK